MSLRLESRYSRTKNRYSKKRKKYQVVIAVVSHLFPFRTEKLSPLAPMVLHSNAGEQAAAFFYKLKPWRQRCLQGSLVFILSFFCIAFGILFALSRLLSVLSSELFCVYSVFFPYCIPNRLVLLLSFFRVTFGILLCLFCLSLELPWEPFCVCIVFALCLFCFCLFFVLFSNRISISSV